MVSEVNVLAEVQYEIREAECKYGHPSSTHESLGVLLEEVHELTEAIRQNSAGAIQKEAIQVAAVALRLAEACNPSSAYVQFALRSNL